MIHKRNSISVGLVLTFMLCFTFESISKPTSQKQEFGSKELITSFIKAVNSGNRAHMGTFISENFGANVLKLAPLSLVVSLNMEFYYQTGGLGYELMQVNSSDSNTVSADLYNKLTESYVNLQIPVADTTSFTINWFIKTEPINAKEGFKQPPKLTEKEMLAKVNYGLKKLKEDDEFSGAVLISRNGVRIFNEAVGDASKSYQIKNKTNTKFNIASVGKIFTGLAVMQLVEQGKLSYDDYVDKYVGTEWLKPEVASIIQIKHLLTHTSGLGDYFKDAYAQNNISVFRDLSDYKILLADDELAFKPGTSFMYSNSGMLILGVIIEKVSGNSYFDYLDEFIFKPSGMYNTGGFYKDRPVENRATGYTKIYENEEVTFDNHQFTRVMRGSPSGGVYSTVEDFLKFDIALKTNKLLSAENTELLFKGRPELNAGFHSYGFFIEEGDAGKIATHKGDGSGVNAQFNMYLDNGYTFVVLSNYSRPSAKIVADIISALINNIEL
ncbi:serine hydrolase [Marinilabilia sp.]|uniref:serine hydrolase domain-containing protein n=1 Tax=Marinilabilia sp. TaxID=2021252 RepID=UPI0025C59749|nr:serine hydrolase domain-containing protein [Marinilabilia sp.]